MAGSQFVKSNDTAILEHLLRGIAEGEVATYEQLSEAIGRDVRKFAAGSLASARRIMERDGLHTGALANEGIKRLLPSECLDKAGSHVTRARRAAARSRRTVETTDFERLDDSDKARAFALSAQATAVESLGSIKTRKRLIGKAAESQSAIPLAETLRLHGVE